MKESIESKEQTLKDRQEKLKENPECVMMILGVEIAEKRLELARYEQQLLLCTVPCKYDPATCGKR